MIIATPDHWHVPIAMAAIQVGKAVFVEKPLSPRDLVQKVEKLLGK